MLIKFVNRTGILKRTQFMIFLSLFDQSCNERKFSLVMVIKWSYKTLEACKNKFEYITFINAVLRKTT